MTLDWPILLPLIFAGLMGLAILIYVVLDGFDLGIGILFSVAEDGGAGHDDRGDRPVLGRQRDLAGAGRRPAAGRLPAGARPHPHRALHSGLRASGRPHPARRRLRLPRQGASRQEAALEPDLLPRLAHRLAGAGLHARRLRARPRRRARAAWPSARWWRSASPRPTRDGRGLAHLQDGRRIAEEGGALAAHGPGADRARHGRGVAGHALRQPAHLRQMVRLAGNALSVAAADPVGGCCSCGCGGRPSICRGPTTAMR